jgi:hypothetical protein
MFFFCNTTNAVYFFGTITGSNISSIWNTSITGPMGLIGALSTPSTNLNIYATSIYGTNVTNRPYWSSV